MHYLLHMSVYIYIYIPTIKVYYFFPENNYLFPINYFNEVQTLLTFTQTSQTYPFLPIPYSFHLLFSSIPTSNLPFSFHRSIPFINRLIPNSHLNN